MRDKLIAPRLCAYCHEPFTPTRVAQRYCPRPARCANFGAARRLKGVVPVQAVAAKQRRDQALVQAACLQIFGALTDREQAIYRFAYQRGYDKGYFTMGRTAS